MIVAVVGALALVGVGVRLAPEPALGGAVSPGSELVVAPAAVIGRTAAPGAIVRTEVGSTAWLAAIHASATGDLRQCIDDHRRSGTMTPAVPC